MLALRKRLTRYEINLLLKRERGIKQRIAEELNVHPQHVSQWTLHPEFSHDRIAEACERHALRIAEENKLSYGEIYVDPDAGRDPFKAFRECVEKVLA